MRLRLDLSYDGAQFHGWAAQPGLRTVQGEVEAALATVLRLESPAPLTCAGRTDAGVHARGQVAHVDLDDATDVERLAHRLRSLLPDDIRLRALAPAPPGFDARFSALERRYVYRLRDRGPGDPLARGHVVDWPRELDVDAMNAAAEPLLGEHDFAAFCKKREGATTIRDPPRADAASAATTACWRRRSAPTRSATRWSAPSWARSSPWASAGSPPTGRRPCSRPPSATRG